MVTQTMFAALVFAVIVQRLWEVSLSRRHEAALRAAGGVEHAAQQMPWMIALHASWLLCMLLEVFVLRRQVAWYVALVALLVFGVGQGLRLWAMRTLGTRWTVKVITLPKAAPVVDGPFRYLRHPNYLGVVLEIAALPLVHGAWLTAVVFTLANGFLLARRIRAEETALSVETDYVQRFRGKARLVPTK